MASRISHAGRALAAALLLAVFTPAPAAVPSPPPPAAPAPAPGTAIVPRSLEVQGGALIAPGKAPEVDILYTGDVVGYIEPCG